MEKQYEIDCFSGHPFLGIEEIKKIIKDNGIEMIRLEFADMNGVNRGKLVPADMADMIFDEGVAFAAVIMGLCYDNTMAQFKGLNAAYDDLKVVGDPTTFKVLPYLEKTAIVLGDLVYHHKPMTQSPRAFLRKMIQQYRELGLNPIAASELEFFLFNKTDEGKYSLYSNNTGFLYTSNVRSDPKGYLTKLTKICKEMDYKVLYMNQEFYCGQYEYNWCHSPALRCADEAFIFKCVSKDLAEQMGMLASFMAKPLSDNGGSGGHFHVSLSDMKTGENLFYDKSAEDGMSRMMRHFIAGVIKHAKALTVFLSPTINCYKRYRPDSFAPYYIGWGDDNRTTYVRIPEEREKATRVEVRAGSAAANPYLALAGILAAGLDGILNELEPPDVITTDLYHDTERQVETVPRSLFRALCELEKDECLCKYASEALIENFIALKRLEVENFINHVTDWEWNTYSRHV